MSEQNYQDCLSEANALPIENIIEPTIPVDVYSQEAEDLAIWAKDDKEALIRVGLEASLIDLILVWSGGLRYAQSYWMKEYKTQEAAMKEWTSRSPAAFELRNDLLAHLGFAFRENDELTGQLQLISEGNTNADMIQDLVELAVLGKANAPLLEAIAFDVASLDEVETTADELSALLARANGVRNSTNPQKIIRDRIFTCLKEKVEKLRSYGRYVFRKDKERLKGYQSEYEHKRYLRRRKNGNNEKEEDIIDVPF